MDLIDRLLAQANTVGQLWPSLLVLSALTALITWRIMEWRYRAVIDGLDRRIQLKDDELTDVHKRLAAAHEHGGASSPLQIELEVWCRITLDSPWEQVVKLNKLIESANPWSDESLQRASLGELAKHERVVPSEQVAIASSMQTAQENLLQVLNDYDEQAGNVHATWNYAPHRPDLFSLSGYSEWRQRDKVVMGEVDALRRRGEFAILAKRLPEDWGRATREHDWPKIS